MIFRRLLALILLCAAVPAHAGEAFFFVARVAPEASLSAPGQGRKAVYLRWGPVEGQLPPEITYFRLLRDGTEIVRVPAQATMNPTEIGALYQGAAQQRRFLESAWQLQRLVVEDPALASFPLSEFPARLAQRLQQDPVFRAFGARGDFNIARATYRGYLDTEASGTVSYELLAENAAGTTVRAGFLADFDTSQVQQLLGPGVFDQVFQGACDELEAGRDEQTIALTWSRPGGDNAADGLASRLFIAGYDLYRGTQNLPEGSPPPVRNLAAEAASLPHDAQGRVVFPGLEPVNDVLLTIDGAQAGEAVFLETHDQVAAAGMRPGDHRAYYLVPRDFSGQYGPTLATDVVVPDLARPPAPWDVRKFADGGAEVPAFEMSWDAVNAANFRDNQIGGNQICNLGEAEQTGVYELVPATGSCATDVRRRLRLDVSEYRVYRFDNFVDARDFRDTDGDGLDDDVERAAIASKLLPPGAQCIAQAASTLPAQLQPQLRLATQATVVEDRLASGRTIIRMRDTVPLRDPSTPDSDDRGRVYWYRLASVTPDGRVSHLSAAIRGIFPERDAPLPPQVRVEKKTPTPDGETPGCDCALDVVDSTRPWQLVDGIGTDEKIGWSCGGASFTQDVFSAANQRNDVLCRDPSLLAACAPGTPTQLRYQLTPPDKNGGAGRFCTVDLPADTAFCQQGVMVIRPADCGFEAVALGESFAGKGRITAEFPAGSCGSIFRKVAGEQVKIATSCGTDSPGVLVVDDVRGTFCGSAISQDDSNDLSPAARIPCFKAGSSAAESAIEDVRPPPPPQLLSLDFLGDSARVRWQLPAEPIAATLVEVSRSGNPDEAERLTRSVATLGSEAGETLRELIALPEAIRNGESWCARIRAVSSAGSTNAASVWSPPLCAQRGEGLVYPEYLPWPMVPEAPRMSDLRAINGLSLFEPATYERSIALIPLAAVDAIALSGCDFEPKQGRLAVPGGALVEPICPPQSEAQIAAELAEQWDFVVYRQSREVTGVASDWKQVSPLIDRIHWERSGGLRQAPLHQLADPYLKLYAADPAQTQWVVAYADMQPRFTGREYRYQVVYFSKDRRIRAWRQTNWLASASVSADIAPAPVEDVPEVLTAPPTPAGPQYDLHEVERMRTMQEHVAFVSTEEEANTIAMLTSGEKPYALVDNQLITSEAVGGLLFEGRLRSYVAVRDNDVVVAFRGTKVLGSGDTASKLTGKVQTLVNTLTDANIQVTQPSFFTSTTALSARELNARVHQGFDKAYLELRDRIRAAVVQHPDKNVYVFGHSLGGALATLCALDLALNPPVSFGSLTHLVSGSPRVGDKIFRALFEDRVPNNLRVVVQNDPIPMIPRRSITGTIFDPLVVDFVHVGRLLQIRPDGELIAPELIETRLSEGDFERHANELYRTAVGQLKQRAASAGYFDGRSSLPQVMADAEREKTR